MSHAILSTVALVLATLPAATLAGSNSPASHETARPHDSIRIVVPVSDLDLASDSGVEALNLRVHTAAKAGCIKLYKGDKWSRQLQPGCTKKAVASVRPQAARAILVARANNPLNSELAMAPER